MQSDLWGDQLRAEVERQAPTLKTAEDRRLLAARLSVAYRIHEDFVAGFIEDVVGTAAASSERPTVSDHPIPGWEP